MGLCQFVSNGGSPGFPLGIPHLLFRTCRWGKRSVFQRAYGWMNVECGFICKETDGGGGRGTEGTGDSIEALSRVCSFNLLSLAVCKPSHRD